MKVKIDQRNTFVDSPAVKYPRPRGVRSYGEEVGGRPGWPPQPQPDGDGPQGWRPAAYKATRAF